MQDFKDNPSLTSIHTDEHHQLIENQLLLADMALNMITDAVYLFNDVPEIIYVNQTACNAHGYSRSELIGKRPADIDPIITPDELANIRESIRSKTVIQFQTKHQHKDGSLYNVEVTTYPYMDGKYGLHIVKNIDERIKTEEKMKLLANVFISTKEGIVITDVRGTIIEANEAYTLITGYSLEEVIGQNAGFLKSDKHDKKFFKHMWDELIKNKYWIGEIWNRRKSGEVFVERLTISAICDDKGKIISYVGLLSDITTGKEYESTLERMAFYDSLTGLPNRLLFSERINQAMTIAKRLKNMMAVCYLDVDGFKPVNDRFGHSAGDDLLIEIAQRMLSNVRESDTVARIGGDEFAILLLNINNAQECENIVNKILDNVHQPYKVNEECTIQMSVSIGITLFPQDELYNAETLLRHADQAMYLAKESGKNQYIFHSQSL